MNSWYGTLTIDNLEEVSKMILDFLIGQRYTFVAANELFGFKPEVRTGQELKNGTNGSPLSTWTDQEQDPPRFAGFNICDSYGVWGCSTSIGGNKHANHRDYTTPYILFDRGVVTITHRAPSGDKLYWVLAPEQS